MDKRSDTGLCQDAIAHGLHNDVFASWVAALDELRRALGAAQFNERYQFCCGYLQALIDSRSMEPHQCGLLRAGLLEVSLGAGHQA
jgi:hypothetical protein